MNTFFFTKNLFVLYAKFNSKHYKSYDGRIRKIRCSKNDEITELGFIRFAIAVTPRQLEIIRNDTENLKAMVGLTCMHSVKRVLKKYTGYKLK